MLTYFLLFLILLFCLYKYEQHVLHVLRCCVYPFNSPFVQLTPSMYPWPMFKVQSVVANSLFCIICAFPVQ